MKETFHATYERGLLRLDTPIDLPERTRVTVTVQNVEDGQIPGDRQPISAEQFDRMLDDLVGESTPLPPEFSREDIYLEHD